MTVERDAGATRDSMQLQYEVLHNLVVETTRLGIEVKNLKMRVESLTGRLEFNERRARALESVVVYKSPEENGTTPRGSIREATAGTSSPGPSRRHRQSSARLRSTSEGPGQRSRRRRRRRGRRGGGLASTIMGGPAGARRRPRRTPRRREMRPGRHATAAGEHRARDSVGIEPRAGDHRTNPDTAKSEARSRRSALRPGNQRRRRAPCPLHRRAPGPPRRSRGADHVRHRLRVVAQRAASRRRNDQRRVGPPISACDTNAIPLDFGRRSDLVFDQPHSLADELSWLDAEGPTSPSLVRLHHAATPRRTTICFFFSYRYYHAYHGARAAPCARDARADG